MEKYIVKVKRPYKDIVSVKDHQIERAKSLGVDLWIAMEDKQYVVPVSHLDEHFQTCKKDWASKFGDCPRDTYQLKDFSLKKLKEWTVATDR